MLFTYIFFGAVLLASYVLAGYPLILAVLTCLRPRATFKARQRRTVSVIIPVHNGQQFIRDKLTSVFALNYPRNLIEVLVVTDGCTDKTAAIVDEFASSGVRLLQIPRSGKCAALNLAIPLSKGDLLLLTDVRQSLAPDGLQALVDCFADPSVGVVSGEMTIRKGLGEDEASTGLYWRYESWIRLKLSSIDSIFGATGPFYALRRELAVSIPVDMLLDDMYMPLAAFFKGYRLIVEPRAQAIDFPTTRKIEFLRKVRTLAGNYQILRAYPALLGPRNRMWFHYLSYKVGRLLLPWLFIAILLTSFFLLTPIRWVALAGEALFYGGALADPLIPDGSRLKRLTSISHTFVAMLIAGVWALAIFVVPPRSLWKETKVAPHRT